MTTSEYDATQSSRTRLLMAGKRLFARQGYEQTSTAAIARESGSSESQLIRYFGGKAGLLEAIFNDSWVALNRMVTEQIHDAPHGREALVRTLSLMVEALNRDPETAFLFLFEGRRTRGGSHEVVLSEGFAQFTTMVDALIERGRADGSIRSDIDKQILAAGIIGAAEGMIRERVLAVRNQDREVPDEAAVVTAFRAMANGLAPQ